MKELYVVSGVNIGVLPLLDEVSVTPVTTVVLDVWLSIVPIADVKLLLLLDGVSVTLEVWISDVSALPEVTDVPEPAVPLDVTISVFTVCGLV